MSVSAVRRKGKQNETCLVQGLKYIFQNQTVLSPNRLTHNVLDMLFLNVILYLPHQHLI